MLIKYLQANCATAPPGQYSCEFGTAKFYALCGLGGIISCGTTHTAIVPLDLVKCRIQVDKAKYKGIFQGFKISIKEEGIKGLAKGWALTFIGYSMQGLGKFGLYEVFKHYYAESLSKKNAYLWRTSVYLAASASAELFADILLCPMEAVKVRIQTMPGYANTLIEAVKNADILVFVLPHQFLGKVCDQFKGHLKQTCMLKWPPCLWAPERVVITAKQHLYLLKILILTPYFLKYYS